MLDLADGAYIGLINIGAQKPASYDVVLPTSEAPASLQLLVQHLATLPSLPQHLSILKSLTSSLAADTFIECKYSVVGKPAVFLPIE